ncbi:MAG: hypothetical protein ACKVX7_02680 [Planctomycetota bacterium]
MRKACGLPVSARRRIGRPANSPTIARRVKSFVVTFALLAFVCIELLFCVGVASAENPVSAGGPLSGGAYQISLGSPIVVPGQTVVYVETLITSPQAVSGYQFSLDYDPAVLSLVGVDFIGTESALLHPVVELFPSLPPITSVRVEYPPPEALVAGNEVLAMYLVFVVMAPGTGSGVSLETIITPTVGEPFMPQITAGGSPQTPLTAPGYLTLYFGELLQIEPGVGVWNEPVSIPVRLWSSGPGAIFMLGLDFVDWFTISIDADGDAWSGFSFTPIYEPSPTNPDNTQFSVIVTPSAGGEIPVMSGEIIFHLIVTPSSPVQGAFPLSPVPSLCTLDGAPIDNLLAGTITLLDEFVRGDANSDGIVGTADPIALLGSIFGTGPLVICPDAGDVNDDNAVNVVDAVQLIHYLFIPGSSPPPAPFPAGGVDPTTPTGDLPCWPDYY